MGLTDREKEWGNRASRFLKAELKRAGVGYKELAERLNQARVRGNRDFDHRQAGARLIRHIVFSCLSSGAGA